MLRLTAIQYRQTYTSGHSCPCLVEAESLEGDRFEAVLKLRESVHGKNAGLARELVASRLAAALGLPAPRAFLVEVTTEFAESIAEPKERVRFQENLGWHFASHFLGAGWHAVPFRVDLPFNLIDRAASIFAFDALIRNDDRHFEKANYLAKGATIMVIDHERAFPTTVIDGPPPWEPGGLEFLRKHVFYRALYGQLPDFEAIAAAMDTITDADLEAMLGSIPEQWEGSGISAELRGYLVALRAKFRTVLDGARTLLR